MFNIVIKGAGASLLFQSGGHFARSPLPLSSPPRPTYLPTLARCLRARRRVSFQFSLSAVGLKILAKISRLNISSAPPTTTTTKTTTTGASLGSAADEGKNEESRIQKASASSIIVPGKRGDRRDLLYPDGFSLRGYLHSSRPVTSRCTLRVIEHPPRPFVPSLLSSRVVHPRAATIRP